jgi:hypothetical protein
MRLTSTILRIIRIRKPTLKRMTRISSTVFIVLCSC